MSTAPAGSEAWTAGEGSRPASAPLRRRSDVAPAASSRSRLLVLAIAAQATVVLVGWIDHATGEDFGLQLFYLLPIAACGWWVNRSSAVLAALTASATWFAADHALRGSTLLAASLWNAGTRLVVFLALGLLTDRVRRQREQLAELIRRLEGERDREAQLARTDTLTGLPNSRAFLEELSGVIAAATVTGGSLSLIYLDLDNFKQVNDAFGHAAGDEVLRRVGVAIRAGVRSADPVARVGGDEFAIAMPDAAEDRVQVVSSLILDQVAGIGRDYPGAGLGASIGVAHFRTPPADADAAIRDADTAMYEAKAQGKAKVVVRRG